jgi:hypothetical protein
MKSQTYADGTPVKTMEPVHILSGTVLIGIGLFMGVTPNADGALANIEIGYECDAQGNWSRPDKPVVKSYLFTSLLPATAIVNVLGKTRTQLAGIATAGNGGHQRAKGGHRASSRSAAA